MFPIFLPTFAAIFIYPSFPAAITAKSHAPILRLCHLHQSAALPAAECPTDRLGFYPFGLGMLPVQPFAVGRAELRPLVCCASHADDLAAAQTTERPQYLPLSREGRMDVRTVPIGPQPAGRAAVFLRHPPCRKFSAAGRTHQLPFHDASSRAGCSLPRHEFTQTGVK